MESMAVNDSKDDAPKGATNTNNPGAPFPTSEQRAQYGRDWFEHTMTMPASPPTTPYNTAGIQNFVFAEMWSRPGLDMKARRWITLACVAARDTVVPIQAHVYAAMKSGDASLEEMHEFALHFAVIAAGPRRRLSTSASSMRGKGSRVRAASRA